MSWVVCPCGCGHRFYAILKDEAEEVVDFKEAAEALGCSVSTLYSQYLAVIPPYTSHTGKRGILRSDLNNYLRTHRQPLNQKTRKLLDFNPTPIR